MHQSSLLTTKMLFLKMLCGRDRAMLLRLLELFILSSSMLTPAISEDSEDSTVYPDAHTLPSWYGDNNEDSSVDPDNQILLRLHSPVSEEYIIDPNTHFNSSEFPYSSFEESGPQEARGNVVDMWLPNENMTEGADELRMLGSDVMPPESPVGICDILLSAPVPPSAAQVPFPCICKYCKGTVGPKGDLGDRGSPGSPGSLGRRGLQGFKGNRGFTGLQGTKGQKGDNGEKGRIGVSGFMGSKGERGFKGEKGDQGSIGVPGATGPQGETGICPAFCESIPGAPGPQGAPGPAGGRGLPGVKGLMGSKGMKGAEGDLGRTGDPGMNGEKGDQGEQGVCECVDGMNGTDGQPGVKGDKGDKGDAGVQGVQGNSGVKGDMGDMGFMGPPGPCMAPIRSAFSASLNESFPRKDWPIAFHRALTNKQGHFNSSMGTYTAPANGTYVFSFHLAVAEKPLKVGIFLNFQPVLKKTELQYPTTMSQSVVLHLNMRDQVWLQVKDDQTNGLYSSGESTSTFSGYLLYPDSCELPLGRDFGNQNQSMSREYTWDGTQTTTMTPPTN